MGIGLVVSKIIPDKKQNEFLIIILKIMALSGVGLCLFKLIC